MADATISTTHGSYTTVAFGHSRVESTGAHPYWVVRGIGLVDRPPCEEDASDWEDSFQSLDGRWVAAQDLRGGDILYGRDQQQHVVTSVENEELTAEVCSLAIEGHANFAVGDDGALVHNDLCWKDMLTTYGLRKVPGAITHLNVYGHHIVQQTIPKNVTGTMYRPIKDSHDILSRYHIPLLGSKSEVRAVSAHYTANGLTPKLHNLCYAANGYQEIHSAKYVNAVADRLRLAESRGSNFVQKRFAILSELQDMRSIMEAGGRFW